MIVLLIISILLVACGGGASEATIAPTPDPLAGADIERGREIFETGADVLERPCSDCHTLDRDVEPEANQMTAGPSLEGFGARADAAAYIEQSIKDPDAFVVEGYTGMTKLPGQLLSDDDVRDVVAFLISQE